MTRNSILSLLTTLTLLTLAAPERIQAQGTCHDIVVGCDADGHTLDGHENFDTEGYHTYCGTCIEGSCHKPCPLEDQEEQLAYQSILDAASDLNVAGLIDLMADLPSHFHLNHQRRSLQIADCSRTTIVASVLLGDELYAEVLGLAAELPLLTADDLD